MADIFVSYASEDRERIMPLVALLEAEGWSVWWDRELVAGPSFEEKIEEALEAARCVVVAWSEHSIKSRWCRAEANEGTEKGALVPIRIDDVRPPLRFREAHTASLIGWPINPGEVNVLLAGVRDYLGRATARNTQAFSRSERAIAVLPFENLSNEPEQDFFSDGIAEDILNELAKGTELMVRPRSSSFSLRGESIDIPTIGERLHVTHVLDGTVRRAGQRVRVTVQLSEVDTNRSIWSERYDRDLTDIFDVQDEITGEVLHALRAQLSGTRPPRQFVGTEAYNAFLRGRHYLAQGELKLALQCYQTAIRLDPKNADALAGFGRLLDMGGPRRGQSLYEHRIQMTAHFNRVLAIDPAHPQALAWQAENAFFRDRDYQSSINQLVGLVNANPSHEEAYRSLTWVLWAIGREELYLRTTQRMVEIAPLSREAILNGINANLNTGRMSEARQAVGELSRLQIKEDPNSMAWLAILDRDPDALQALVNRHPAGAWYFAFTRTWNSAMVPYLKGEFARAQGIIADRTRGNRALTILEKHMFALIERDFDAALDHYADALEAGLWFAFVRARLSYPFRQTFPEFYEDLRFSQLLREYKLDPVSTAALKIPELNFSTR